MISRGNKLGSTCLSRNIWDVRNVVEPDRENDMDRVENSRFFLDSVATTNDNVPLLCLRILSDIQLQNFGIKFQPVNILIKVKTRPWRVERSNLMIT
jgi:hypothetical protein